MRGRKPKPTAQQELETVRGHRPPNKNEPEFPDARPIDAPPELAGDEKALAEWRRLRPLLQAARVLTEADYMTLIALCQQWSLYLEAKSKLATTGMLVKAPSGYPIVNPYLSVVNRALEHCEKIWTELGLTPSSRSRVNVAPGVNWSGNAQTAKPQTKLAQLQEQAKALRRPVKVK
jgi:P27 family predicted phage terminase small subunit